jgi:benzoyl-CoA reductase/2-hydroxyglutaryl-CoA dehydratase subunit BcrC/BadD/HgdB
VGKETCLTENNIGKKVKSSIKKAEKIGFTTSIPVEIIYAAGKRPVDLNNLFIGSQNPSSYVDMAEYSGFPRNMCSWIKGIYAAAMDSADISEVIGVIQGDCSNAQALLEVLKEQGINTYFFAYPYDKDESYLKLSVKNMMKHYKVGMKKVEEQKKRLDKIRRKLRKIDVMTYKDNIISSFENHYFLISSTDFKQNPDRYEKEIDSFLKLLPFRKPFKEKVRFAYIGVPPIFTDIYDFLDGHGARVVYNEIQHQFSMPYTTKTIYDQYSKFTYPYDVFGRVRVIKNEVRKRRVDGIIHYVQSFCFRQIEDMIIRRAVDVPILLIEGDRPAALDARTKLRIEVFIEMLKSAKK